MDSSCGDSELYRDKENVKCAKMGSYCVCRETLFYNLRKGEKKSISKHGTLSDLIFVPPSQGPDVSICRNNQKSPELHAFMEQAKTFPTKYYEAAHPTKAFAFSFFFSLQS